MAWALLDHAQLRHGNLEMATNVVPGACSDLPK